MLGRIPVWNVLTSPAPTYFLPIPTCPCFLLPQKKKKIPYLCRCSQWSAGCPGSWWSWCLVPTWTVAWQERPLWYWIHHGIADPIYVSCLISNENKSSSCFSGTRDTQGSETIRFPAAARNGEGILRPQTTLHTITVTLWADFPSSGGLAHLP